ncbi:SRPBCC family protein [Sorangium sp. So ce233]|uniref:SRPBCC family protein n=1 Tax=Sorangium sp. So ce233 TaxID=3133290 RepID=UPI003F6195E2
MRRDLRIAREYPHPPELVWRALTEPALIAEWLMQNDFRPELGHRFTLRTDPGPGFDGVVRCEVLELDPPTKMRWSWRVEPTESYSIPVSFPAPAWLMMMAGMSAAGSALIA